MPGSLNEGFLIIFLYSWTPACGGYWPAGGGGVGGVGRAGTCRGGPRAHIKKLKSSSTEELS